MAGLPAKPGPAPTSVTSKVTGTVRPSRVSLPSTLPWRKFCARNAVETNSAVGYFAVLRYSAPLELLREAGHRGRDRRGIDRRGQLRALDMLRIHSSVALALSKRKTLIEKPRCDTRATTPVWAGSERVGAGRRLAARRAGRAAGPWAAPRLRRRRRRKAAPLRKGSLAGTLGAERERLLAITAEKGLTRMVSSWNSFLRLKHSPSSWRNAIPFNGHPSERERRGAPGSGSSPAPFRRARA